MPIRFDSGSLRNVKQTPQGGIEVEAALTRTGVLEYKNPDGSVRREYRPEEEVFRSDTLQTLRGAPVTNEHPPEPISPSNFQQYVVGNVVSEARQDGGLVIADLAIQDAGTIDLVERKQRREVSCGYTCELKNVSGVTPDGERYDAIQTQISYNHVALVPRGRAGRDVSLRLDSDGNQIHEEKSMAVVEKVGGVEYEVGTDAHSDAVSRRDAAEAEAKASHEKVVAERDVLKTQVAELQARVAAMPSEFEAAFTAKLALLDKARAAGAEVRTDMSDDEIRGAVVAKRLPSMDLEGTSSDYIAAAFDIALAENPGNAAEIFKADRTDAVDAPLLAPHEVARQEMISRSRKLSRNGKE